MKFSTTIEFHIDENVAKKFLEDLQSYTIMTVKDNTGKERKFLCENMTFIPDGESVLVTFESIVEIEE